MSADKRCKVGSLPVLQVGVLSAFSIIVRRLLSSLAVVPKVTFSCLLGAVGLATCVWTMAS